MPLAWGLAAVVGLLLALSWGALKIQVALAGFLNGESIWSKSQKQSVIDLDAYAESGNPEELASFQQHYTVLRHFRFAREEVRRDHYDYDHVARLLREDNAMPSAIPMILFMMRHLTQAPYMRESLEAWRSTDSRVDALGVIAERLRNAYAQGNVTPAFIHEQRKAIADLNAYIEPRSNNFSHLMARGAAWVAGLLFGVLAITGVLAVLLWLWLARRVLVGVRGTEERYRLLFDSAADAILMVEDVSGDILQANRMASLWTGLSEDQLRGRPFLELFAEHDRRHRRDRHVSDLRHVDGGTRPVEMSSNVVDWGVRKVRQAILRDITERVDMARERRIASEAMASVAEGVIITDASRRILTVNAAHQRLTGYSTLEVEGMRFDEPRRMPDGQPLPETVWDAVAKDGHWNGEVQCRRRDGSVYPEMLSISAIRNADGQIEHYVAVCTDITDSKAGQRHLQYLATHDALTGLVNRAEFERRVAEMLLVAERKHETVVVVFVDLDNFKLVNDSYSHAIGDKLLTVVAERIHRHLPAGAVASRIGGDEFTVLVGHLKAREDINWFARQLIETLSQPMVVDGYDIVLSASIGIASFPLDGYDATTLLTNADAAMYSAKQEERNTFRFYTPRMRADANRRLLLLTDLRRALQENQFQLLYQPSIAFADSGLLGAEALLRWHHPERGYIMPSEFVPMAETLGLIRHIDEWVLDGVCRQIAQWKRSGLKIRRIAVNISAGWFSHPDFVQQLTTTIERNAVDPQQIMLEITESTILHLGEATRQTMSALHGLGVAIAIDDFGTGYSSLAYLKLPAVAYLKIDRSFVDGLPDSAEDASIVQAMLVMARSLGLAVIAEGVETEAQHDFLRLAGCEEGQGYLYSRPIQADELSELLRRDAQQDTKRLTLVPPRTKP
ncbi:putative bifunctional diguanylate cyclase/phosphodiesterase [Oleiagrimonas soli]|uniref:cyclic-guanylate-specific phosphodiesterase n=1 Tax=Oleiagrimonas soli TaxID=1543381 RepID=A0A099CVK8_9GAMM|nr:EAL domain-containing protein [Oleiagrimonas soli]KGI77652.1 diguanylate cyclase [Oleiagrimonas soli]MBB6182837.1 diguanylate cyclase (GGDEF)-like protein/PAS domain S-box-containing protein [Oleiagrimonas soli]